MEGWVRLVGWPTADTLSTKWSSVDHKSGIRESSPARDRRLKQWATPPWPYKTAFASYISCSSWTKTPRNAYQCLLAIQSILGLHRIKLSVWQHMAMYTWRRRFTAPKHNSMFNAIFFAKTCRRSRFQTNTREFQTLLEWLLSVNKCKSFVRHITVLWRWQTTTVWPYPSAVPPCVKDVFVWLTKTPVPSDFFCSVLYKCSYLLTYLEHETSMVRGRMQGVGEGVRTLLSN